jgi:hypothetical protein
MSIGEPLAFDEGRFAIDAFPKGTSLAQRSRRCPNFTLRFTSSRSVSVSIYCHRLLRTMRYGWTRNWSLARRSRTSSRSTEHFTFHGRQVPEISLIPVLTPIDLQFKIAVAVPPTNDVDVFTNDVGFIAIVDGNGQLAGFNVTVGGGMGVTHANKKTYPRLGDLLGFCTAEQGPVVAEKIMLTQRDNGNRAE